MFKDKGWFTLTDWGVKGRLSYSVRGELYYIVTYGHCKMAGCVQNFQSDISCSVTAM